ncbi:HAD hydrolase-like protein [Kribbella sp. NBC_00382]|uniref:HAD family hydrolase n=1 Tax=Kribbella sp. NBC_00382 TaxID=2975967 RepID=UPI002E1ED7DC
MLRDPLAQILSSAEVVLFDFDGPVCSVFDGYPAARITRELLALAREVRGELEPALELAGGPHGLLLAAAGDLELAGLLEAALQKGELAAIETARPTPGAGECIAACVASGRVVAIVSNNCLEAITEYLVRAGLSGCVAHVEGRDPVDPRLMKPDPYLVERAVSALGVGSASCVFVGDQATDMEAGRAAGVRVVGYANKPGKVEALGRAGADVIISSMLELADVLC